MVNLSRPVAIMTTAVLGACVLLTTLPTWVGGTTPTATGDLPVSVAGTAASPAAASVGLVIIAAALVLGLAGRAVRVIALLVVIVTSIGAGVSVVSFLSAPEVVAASAAAEQTSVRAINAPVDITVWPYLSLLALGLAVAAGVWLLTHLGTWKQVGRRYETGESARGADPAEADPQARSRLQAMDDWDAISRGEDPS